MCVFRIQRVARWPSWCTCLHTSGALFRQTPSKPGNRRLFAIHEIPTAAHRQVREPGLAIVKRAKGGPAPIRFKGPPAEPWVEAPRRMNTGSPATAAGQTGLFPPPWRRRLQMDWRRCGGNACKGKGGLRLSLARTGQGGVSTQDMSIRAVLACAARPWPIPLGSMTSLDGLPSRSSEYHGSRINMAL